jgi:hypothetical protein
MMVAVAEVSPEIPHAEAVWGDAKTLKTAKRFWKRRQVKET